MSSPNRFGLMMNSSKGSIYANLDLPRYVNDTFVRTVFDGQPMQNDTDDKEIKEVNPYIYRLTNRKFSSFKSVEQQLAVMGALRVPDGYTAMVAMSTGGGKSLVTQAVSYQYDDSLTVIIVPTISLMLDQHRNASNIIAPKNPNEIMYYNSGCKADELISALDKKLVRMLFISPEALIKNSRIQNSIFKANSEGCLKNLVIDEAHIIIEWGASFRVDFQCLDSFRRLLSKDNPSLRTYLLSATFSKKTVDNLKMFYSDNDRWIEIRLDTLRREPRFDIIKCSSYTEKHNRIKELACKLPRPMIIYVGSPDDAETIRGELAENGFDNTRVFTGRTGADDRERIINEWVDDKFDLMIATCAFGVGVDKKDVRTVIHSYVPSGADQYYQECGRGGRDGLPCLAVMLYTEDDIRAARSMAQKVITVEKLSGRWFSMLNSGKANIRLDSVVLDTSVKPDYNDDDTFYDEVKNADVIWNVYVILLLRRRGLIRITDVRYENDRYIFGIELVDKQIRYDTPQTAEQFGAVRDKEINSVYSDIKKLALKLHEVGKSCWSSMFNDIYRLTDEFCAGCNNHNDIRAEKKNSFPLKKTVDYPVSMPTGLSGILEPSKLNIAKTKTSYFRPVFETAKELGLIGCNEEKKVVFTGKKEDIKSLTAFRLFCNSVVFKDRTSEFYKIISCFLEANDEWLSYGSVTASDEVIKLLFNETGISSVRLEKDVILGVRFWINFLGFGFFQEQDKVFLPNMYTALKDFMLLGNIEKGKEYSVEEFLDNLHSGSAVSLKNARTSLTLNLAMSNALRLLHDNKEIELKKHLDSEKIWHLFPNEDHEFTSDITHIIIKKAVK